MEWQEAALQFRNVSFHSPVSGLQSSEITLDIFKGDVAVLLGPEGSGKGSIMELLGGEYAPDSGEMRILGYNPVLEDEKLLEKLRSRIGYVSYYRGLISNMSAYENIVLPVRYHESLSGAQLSQRANYYITRYELQHAANARPQMLRPSEELRVALVRALITLPDFVVIDNAFEGHCPLSMHKILLTLREDLDAIGAGLVLTSYTPLDIPGREEDYYLFFGGKIVFRGTRKDLRETDNAYVRQYLDLTDGPMPSYYKQ